MINELIKKYQDNLNSINDEQQKCLNYNKEDYELYKKYIKKNKTIEETKD